MLYISRESQEVYTEHCEGRLVQQVTQNISKESQDVYIEYCERIGKKSIRDWKNRHSKIFAGNVMFI